LTAYEVLLQQANDPRVQPHLRQRAAEAAVPYERPKLSATVQRISVDHDGIAGQLERARRRLALANGEDAAAQDYEICPPSD